MNDKDQKLINAVLDDLTEVLRARGKSEKEIKEIVLQIIAEVEVQVIEELHSKLSDDQKKLLGEMSDQKKSADEIAQALSITNDQLAEIEIRTFANVVEQLLPAPKK